MTSVVQGQTTTGVEVGDEFSFTVKEEYTLNINGTNYDTFEDVNEKYDVVVTNVAEEIVEFTAEDKDGETTEHYNDISEFLELLEIGFGFKEMMANDLSSFRNPSNFNVPQIDNSEENTRLSSIFSFFVPNDDQFYDDYGTFLEEVLADIAELEISHEEGKSFNLEVIFYDSIVEGDDSFTMNFEYQIEIDIEESIAKYQSLTFEMDINVGDASKFYQIDIEVYEGFRLFGLNTTPLWTFITSIFGIAIFYNRIAKKKFSIYN
ncbi:MAG: hypothetical protein OEY49_06615 [Candidatus Heimdallarchaeota archaeon]|nr:hypothetical protein [Candidatus Heimdallarchaeota archaeon]